MVFVDYPIIIVHGPFTQREGHMRNGASLIKDVRVHIADMRQWTKEYRHEATWDTNLGHPLPIPVTV